MGGRVGRLGHGQRGSVSAMEMIILAPVFMMLFLFVVFCGRLINAKGIVDGAARDAARAASIARSEVDARLAATTAVSEDLSGMAPVQCAFGAPLVSGWRPGGEVTVEVSCTVPLADLALLGVPGSRTITASHKAPVDRFRGTP